MDIACDSNDDSDSNGDGESDQDESAVRHWYNLNNMQEILKVPHGKVKYLQEVVDTNFWSASMTALNIEKQIFTAPSGLPRDTTTSNEYHGHVLQHALAGASSWQISIPRWHKIIIISVRLSSQQLTMLNFTCWRFSTE